MEKCPFCGNEIEEGGKFCGSCGHPLTNIEPVEQAEAIAENAAAPAPTEAPIEPVEAPVAPAAPTEAPIEPVAAPAAPTAAPVQPPVPAQAPQSPAYGAVQQPAPGYAPQQYGTMTQTAPKKNKKGMVLAIIVGAVVVLGLLAAVLVLFSGGSGHALDGEYKLTALTMGGQDYSSYISYLEDGYHLTVNGSECTIEVAGSKTTAKIDQSKHTISTGATEIVEFTVEGDDIILEAGEYSMTFTKQ